MGQLVLIAVATFLSEDLTCVATGALIAAGKLGFVPGVLACIAGIYFGDLLLYFAGRLIGRPIVRWRPLRRLLSEEKLNRASVWLAQRGAAVVILSRFTPGLRLPTYVAAGLLQTRFWTFSLYFLLAAIIWTPLLVGGAVIAGKNLPHLGLLGPAILLVGAPVCKLATARQVRRRFIGRIRRILRWEFWPPWLAYIPVACYILHLGIRYRSLTLFTAANPGIPSSGFVGESKSAILSNLAECAEFELLPASLPMVERICKVKDFLTFPVVVKPDVGERGAGVAIVRNDRELAAYFEAMSGDAIVQQYVTGPEFGIFYYRYPGETEGRIFSITEKSFPFVAGDGSSTIADLVLKDDRAVCLADLYLSRLERPPDEVPAAGEVVPLAEIGSHCRGAIFLDGARLETDALRAAIDRVAHGFPGFYFGRFDVRSPSVEALRAGRFTILELNGVSAEATHIYDPAVPVYEAYRVLFQQWRIAFEIGAHNRDAGWLPMTLGEFVALLRRRER
jgi:membrane protein DedA with SNARE-associated domain